MDPSTLIPAPDPLQVPWGWFQLLLIITLFLHIIMMNVMLGTGIIALVNHFRGESSNDPLTREIAGKLPYVIAFTVNFGVAPLLFMQVLYGHLFYTSSVLMANLWLFVIIFLISGYYLAYIYNYKYDVLQGARVPVLGYTVFALLAIAFFMTNNFTMTERPEVWIRYFENPTGLLLNLADPTFFPRYLHIITAAVAVGGLSIGLFFECKRRQGDDAAVHWIQYGCNWFGYSTIVNFGLGFMFYATLPERVRSLSHPAGVLIALILIVVIILGGLSVINSMRGKLMPTVYTALPIVFLMILVRDVVRVAYLRPYFSVADLKVVPQYSPMIVFFLIFAGGLYLLYWMIRLILRIVAKKEISS